MKHLSLYIKKSFMKNSEMYIPLVCYIFNFLIQPENISIIQLSYRDL